MSSSIPTVQQQLESYILSIENLDIHNFEKSKRLCPRDQNPSSLYDYHVNPLNTTLKVRRNVDTGEVIDFTEVCIESTPNIVPNSTNLENNLIEDDDILSDKLNHSLNDSQFDLDSNLNDLLFIPPGFEYGLLFNENGEVTQSNSLDGSGKKRTTKRGVKTETVFDLSSLVNVDNTLLENSLNRNSQKSDKILNKEEEIKSKTDHEEESSVIPEDSIPILKITDTKVVDDVKNEDWAEKVSLNADLNLFRQKIPILAHEFPFELDPFQKQAIMKLEEHKHLFVAAHTSAGKTVVAEYAIALSKKHLTKTIYTSPIKALSNQKYRDFRKTFQDVGLITGDFRVNDTAACLIMTTEILRSMLYRGSDVTRDLEYVIFDEVHYINDSERGHVWEEVLVLLPTHVCIIMLSATVPNAMELANWLGCIKKRKVYVITTTYRPVPLRHYVYTNVQSKPEINLIMNEQREFLAAEYQKILNKWTDMKKMKPKTKNQNQNQNQNQKPAIGSTKDEKRYFLQLIDFLNKTQKLPAVIFIFSRAKCDLAAEMVASIELTSKAEQFLIEKFFEKSIKSLKDEDQTLPQISRMKILLINGIGVHHSGILPILKEIVEICFQNGWTKILFATETFAMGVNMPTRTVLFNSIRKFDGIETRCLKPAEYIQMAGRAGRRGLDDIGTVCILVKDKPPESIELRLIMTKNAESLKSQFKITYRMLLNVLRVERLSLDEIISHSFRENFNSKSRHEMNTEINRTKAILNKNDTNDINLQLYEICQLGFELACGYTIFMSTIGYRLRKLLYPGRVLLIGDRIDLKFALLVDLMINQHRSELKVLVQVDRCDEESAKMDQIIGRSKDLAVRNKLYQLFQLLKGGAVFEPTFRAGFCFRTIQLHDVYKITNIVEKYNFGHIINDAKSGSTKPSYETIEALQMLAGLARNPQSVTYLDMKRDCKLKDIDTIQEYDRLEVLRNQIRSIRDRISFSDSELLNAAQRLTHEEKLNDLIYQQSVKCNVTYMESDRKKQLLRDLDYINNQDKLTLRGTVACQISTNELILTQLILDGLLSKLKAAEVAAVLSALVFEAKTNVDNTDLLNDNIKQALIVMQQIYDDIRKTEEMYGIQKDESCHSQELNLGLVYVVYKWAQNCPFSEIMECTDVQEGIIVRCIQQLHEMLQDVRNAAKLIGDPTLQAIMEDVSLLIKRDIVFAISLYTQ